MSALASIPTASSVDLHTVRVSLVLPVSGFAHQHYPIYLNQNTKQAALSVSYRVYACLNGQPEQAIDVNQHKLRIMPILRYGQTACAVPEPACFQVPVASDEKPEAQPRDRTKRAVSVVAVNHQPESDHLYKMSFRISPDCFSVGGFETTVRLRLLVLSPVDDVVLSFVDSSRFVVRAREFPPQHHMAIHLRDWGFPVAEGDAATLASLSQDHSGKRRRPNPPSAPVVEDEQEPNPMAISMPNGKLMFTLRGVQAMNSHPSC